MRDANDTLIALGIGEMGFGEMMTLWTLVTGHLLRRLEIGTEPSVQAKNAELLRQTMPLVVEKVYRTTGLVDYRNTSLAAMAHDAIPAGRRTLLDLITRRMLIETRFALRNIIAFGYEPWQGQYVLDQLDNVLKAGNLPEGALRNLAVDIHAIAGDWRER